MTLDLRNMAALNAIIEEQSFDKAARRLHITQSAVSQRLKQLEDQLGQLLVVRGTPIRTTPAGRQVIAHYQQVTLLQSELLQALNSESGEGYSTLSIGVNADSLETWFLDAMQPVLSSNKLLLDLKIDDQDQTQRLLRDGEVLGCITASPNPMQGCSCTPLGVMPYRCVASPDYLARHFANGVDSEGFRHAPVAEFNNKDELQNRYLGSFFGLKPGDYAKHRIPAAAPFLDLIRRGYACGMVPDQMSRPLLDSGELIDMSPGHYLAVPLYWHAWNLKSKLAALITAALTDAASRTLDPFEQHPNLTHP